ncbi:unnamed protein product [Rotaria socialis]|uniref:Synaptosomal-associated protein n=1 Tax=Rotaria socialis TaxID=392032 RepID=A0A817QQK9_9BILA|nr:unnamed protein product [Rotaria socialis]
MNDETMRNELSSIQMQMNQTTNDSLESTRRMLALCDESKEAGIRTLVMLDEQGEQLDAIDSGMDRINAEMRDAEKNLEGLEKCCGLCVLPWKRSKNVEKSAAYSKTFKGNEDGKVNASGPRQVVGQNGVGPGSGYIQKGFANNFFLLRITNDAREDEMEENLQQVSTVIGNLRNMACDMGNEIENQNNQIDRIKGKTDISHIRIEEANKRAKTLLKS